MRVAILYAPDDHEVAEHACDALGVTQAFTTPYASTVAFGPQLVLLAVWSRNAAPYADKLRALIEGHRGMVVWRADGAEAPAGLERFTLGADASPRGLATALKLAEKEIVRPDVDDAPRRRGGARRIVATAAGAGIALALGAAGAAAFMLDGQESVTMAQGRAAAEATR